MSKRGDLMMDQLATVIIIGIALIILLLYVGRWTESIQSQGEIKACQYSVQTFTISNKATLDTLKPQIKCPAPHVDVTGDLESDKKQVAELVRTCWAKTNGKDNGIARTENGRVREILGFEKGDSFCILCSSFTVDKTIIVADLKDYMDSKTMVQQPSQTYKEFLDTSWMSSGADPLNNLFYSLSKPGIVPMPGAAGALDGAKEAKTIDAGAVYYIVDFSKGEGNNVAVTSQAEAGNLACDRFLQQREQGTKAPTTKTS